MSLLLTPNPVPMDPNDRHARHNFSQQQQQQQPNDRHPRDSFNSQHQPDAPRAPPPSAYDRPSSAAEPRPGSIESYVVDHSSKLYSDSRNVRPEIVTSTSAHPPPPPSHSAYSSPDMNPYRHSHPQQQQQQQQPHPPSQPQPSPAQQQQRPQYHARLPSLQTILGPPDDSPRSPHRQPLDHSASHHTTTTTTTTSSSAPAYPSSAYTTSPPSSSSGPPPLTRPPQEPHSYGSRPPTQSSLGYEQSARGWPVANEALAGDSAGSVGTRSPYSESASSAHYSTAPSDALVAPPLHRPPHAPSLSTQHPPRSSHTRSSSEQSGSDRGTSPRDLARPASSSNERLAPPTSAAAASAASAASPTASGPQFMGIQNIGEEGPCYVYTDGTYCRTEIAGEPVNPEWGVTKAGKPRKRLAQACISCREKKIKCEPGYPKCNQCQKLGRTCRRSSHNRSSPDATPGTDQRPTSSHRDGLNRDASRDRSSTPKGNNYLANSQLLPPPPPPPPPQQQQTPKQQEPGSSSSSSAAAAAAAAAEKSGARPASPVTRDSPDWRWPKKARLSSAEANSPGYHVPANATALDRDMAASGCNLSQLLGRLNWETDPFDVIPNMCTKLVNIAFTNNAEGSVYTLYPHEPFYRWLRECRWKDKADRMLTYALMAYGFSYELNADSAMKSVGLRIAEIATAAVHEQLGRHANSIQLVQSRLFLHTYYISRGKVLDGWEQLGATFRVMLNLGLNKESGILSLPMTTFESALNQSQAYESRRRTFWLAYLFQTYSGFFRGRVGLLNDSDIFLRMPNNEVDYIDRCSHVGPLFDGGRIDWTMNPNMRIGNMAMLIGIASIFNSVYAHAYRAINSARMESADAYEDFYNTTKAQLEEWRNRLPADMQSSPTNFSKAREQRRFAAYFNIHAMHQATVIALARYGPVEQLSSATIRRSICEAYRSTRNLLALTNAVCRDHLDANKRTADVEQSLSQPFLGYCIMAACDIACSGGKVESLQTTIGCLTNAIRILDEIARLWGLTRKQSELVNERLCELSAHAVSSKDRNFWRLDRPFTGSVIPVATFDILYGSPNDLYYEAIDEFTCKG